MASKLELMRAKLAERENRRKGSPTGDKASYPFWNIPDSTSCTLRLLPDKDESNFFFWVELLVYKWTLVDNLNPGKTLSVRIPCIEMYDPEGNTSCPIKKEIGNFFRTKDPDDEAIGRKFWPKGTYIYEGFVRKSQLVEQEPPENPIRIFTVNKDLHKTIKSAVFSDNEELLLDALPVDFDEGTDFIIEKTKNGRWPEYKTSAYSRKSSPLTDHERAMIEKFGLWDLKSRLPQKPSDEAYIALGSIFEAALEGNPWNPEWDKYFKPWRENGTRTQEDDDNTKENVPSSRTSSEEPSESAETKVAVKASDALSKLKASRSEKPAEEIKPDEDVIEEKAEQKPSQSSKNTAELLAKLRSKK